MWTLDCIYDEEEVGEVRQIISFDSLLIGSMLHNPFVVFLSVRIKSVLNLFIYQYLNFWAVKDLWQEYRHVWQLFAEEFTGVPLVLGCLSLSRNLDPLHDV